MSGMKQVAQHATLSRRRRFDLEDRLIGLAVLICKIAEALPRTRMGTHVAGQIMRLATSPAPVYCEAQSAESRGDFIHKLKLCLKEIREVHIWLKFLKRFGIGPNKAIDYALEETDELKAIFYKSIQTAERRQKAAS